MMTIVRCWKRNKEEREANVRKKGRWNIAHKICSAAAVFASIAPSRYICRCLLTCRGNHVDAEEEDFEIHCCCMLFIQFGWFYCYSCRGVVCWKGEEVIMISCCKNFYEKSGGVHAAEMNGLPPMHGWHRVLMLIVLIGLTWRVLKAKMLGPFWGSFVCWAVLVLECLFSRRNCRCQSAFQRCNWCQLLLPTVVGAEVAQS